MKHQSLGRLLIFLPFIFSLCSSAQNVGVGTDSPLARLHVADSSVVFTAQGGSTNAANVPVSGTGKRMMWYAPGSAFRAGVAVGAGWDRDSIGIYSFAGGFGCRAIGSGSSLSTAQK